MAGDIFRSAVKEEEQTQWMPVSDLMAALMMVFLFISVSMMRYALIERDRIKEVAVAYQETQVAIYDALVKEFSADLPAWGAEIDKETLTVAFQSPDINFTRGSTRLTSRYQSILSDFFPRYINLLEPFQVSVSEVRLEGHTSSLWRQESSIDEAYFNNMELSQERTRSVLRYVYNLNEVSGFRPWIKANVAAVGLSSSKLKLTSEGLEDKVKSRRVSFRVLTNADIQIKKILNI